MLKYSLLKYYKRHLILYVKIVILAQHSHSIQGYYIYLEKSTSLHLSTLLRILHLFFILSVPLRIYSLAGLQLLSSLAPFLRLSFAKLSTTRIPRGVAQITLVYLYTTLSPGPKLLSSRRITFVATYNCPPAFSRFISVVAVGVTVYSYPVCLNMRVCVCMCRSEYICIMESTTARPSERYQTIAVFAHIYVRRSEEGTETR